MEEKLWSKVRDVILLFCLFEFEKCCVLLNRKVTKNLEEVEKILLDSIWKKYTKLVNWKAEELLKCTDQCKLSKVVPEQKWKDKDKIKAEINLFIHHYSRHSIILLWRKLYCPKAEEVRIFWDCFFHSLLVIQLLQQGAVLKSCASCQQILFFSSFQDLLNL